MAQLPTSSPTPPPAHHAAGGFKNNYLDLDPPPLSQVLRWRWQSWRQGLPHPPSGPIPQAAPALDFLHGNAQGAAQQPAVTWIGHATVLAQLGGLTLLTDPIFSERASPLAFAGPRRHQPPGLALAQLPHVDLVLLSHNHYDHLDTATLAALARQPGGPPLCVVPLGLAGLVTRQGLPMPVELDWWQTHHLPGGVDVMLLPSQHWSARGLGDRMQTLWGGFAVLAPDCHLFYAGDTGYSRDFQDIRTRLAPRQGPAQGGGFDIALLPIGAYAPRWFMAPQHVDVPQALDIHRDLGAKRALGVHWGTFQLTDEPLDEPPRVLASERAARGLEEADFFTLAIGETRRIPPRPASQLSI